MKQKNVFFLYILFLEVTDSTGRGHRSENKSDENIAAAFK
jgi:hypothetical protein